MLYRLVFYSIATVLLFSCAHPVSPGGGAKDKDAPVVLGTSPENGSANFKKDRFTIDFDEFVELQDAQNQILISPPLQNNPDYKIKGKSVQVKFNEALKENTTYSVYFGDAIVDITEGNPISNYTYIFSTGPFTDSLSLQGVVKDAFTLDPVSDCFVMLYKDDNDTISLDSMPLLVRPYYLSKTDDLGRYRFSGLGYDKYLLFAIIDMNGSLSFDLPNEQIGFIDSLISPTYINKPIIDSTAADSTFNDSTELIVRDTVMGIQDSLVEKKDDFFSDEIITYNTLLFTEKQKKLKLLSYKLIRDNTLQFIFNLPAKDVQINQLSIADREQWYFSKVSKDNDTITWFMKDMGLDTLNVLIRQDRDTLELLEIRLEKPNVRPNRRKDKEEKKPLLFEPIPKNKKLLPGQNPGIRFFQPIDSISLDSAVLINVEDTIINPEFVFMDSLKMSIGFKINNIEDSRYKILIPDSSIYDWNGSSNDELKINFSSIKLSEYGQLTMKITNSAKQKLLIQLFIDKDKVLKQDAVDNDTVLIYKYLSPVKYGFKVIFDDNGNGKWDVGEYSTKQQAERVEYFEKLIEVRANWEIEEEWDIK